MILLVFMGIYFALCIKTLILGEDNLRLTGLGSSDLTELGAVPYSDSNVLLFAIIRNDLPGAKTPYVEGSANFSQYVNVYWT
jgi:hypothetical protein